jgi:hypothetical protein
MAVKATKTGAAGKQGVVQKQRTPAPDQVTTIRAPGGQGYGENGSANPSSVAPGKTVRSQLAQNLLDSVDDPAIDEVIAKGTARNVHTGDMTGRVVPVTPSSAGGFDANNRNADGLLLDIASGARGGGRKSTPSPVHSSMAPRGVAEGSPGGPVPSGVDLGATANPVRKPS